jgi:hypothetical protein
MYWVLTSEKYPTEIRGIDSAAGINVVASRKPVAPTELNDKIPISLSKLVMECCREKPVERPADMKQVIARLAVVRKLWKKYRESIRSQRRTVGAPPAAASPTSPSENKTEGFSVEDGI